MKTFEQFLMENLDSESVQDVKTTKKQNEIANKLTDGNWARFQLRPEMQKEVAAVVKTPKKNTLTGLLRYASKTTRYKPEISVIDSNGFTSYIKVNVGDSKLYDVSMRSASGSDLVGNYKLSLKDAVKLFKDDARFDNLSNATIEYLDRLGDKVVHTQNVAITAL